MIFDVVGCEEKIGYTFKDKMLLRQCFTHASYANEHNENDNELLEFFGDTIIKFVDSEFLFKNTSGDEGKLTDRRKDIESNEALLKTVKKLDLDKYVLLGNGQNKTAHRDEKLFSSIYEALVAGIYIDGGLAAAKKFITDTIIADYVKNEKKKKSSDNGEFKNEFQEYVQKRKLGSISYETLNKKGPDHLPEFKVAALLNGAVIAEGKGPSKKAAESSAAQKALKKLVKQGGNKK